MAASWLLWPAIGGLSVAIALALMVTINAVTEAGAPQHRGRGTVGDWIRVYWRELWLLPALGGLAIGWAMLLGRGLVELVRWGLA